MDMPFANAAHSDFSEIWWRVSAVKLVATTLADLGSMWSRGVL